MDETDVQLRPPIDYFPMVEPREKQIRALDFVRRAHAQGYNDIIIAAPTGIGKTGIGAAIALWAQQVIVDGDYEPGAYYLVTQKLLQDQLAEDMSKFKPEFRRGCTLKSSIEYKCDQYGTCMAGLRMQKEKRCKAAAAFACKYRNQKGLFQNVPLAVTNYPYFFTERTYVGEFKNRRVLIADECHTLEKQVLGFVEININREILENWTPHLRPVPRLKDIYDFADWLEQKYMPVIKDRIESLNAQLESRPSDIKLQEEVNSTETHYNRNLAAIQSIDEDANNWVYWQEKRESSNDLESVAKPISATAFTKQLLFDAASIRVYMSAFPGPKGVFCRSLGLDPEKVAWLSLSSTFPKENRPIHMVLVGSMGQKSIETTMPSMLRMCERILKAHENEKGLIHCHSYRLGEAIFNYLAPRFPGRIIFPKTGKERDASFAMHKNREDATVMLSPSMTEGFNLQDDLARFQIIAKMPYPYLGDKQVAAKKARDPDWYDMQTVMTVLQACGRIVRSDTDHGATYIVDSDFQMLYERHPDFFPRWFEEAFVWHKK
jgi:ATP-dependent DNA helicase DinG